MRCGGPPPSPSNGGRPCTAGATTTLHRFEPPISTGWPAWPAPEVPTDPAGWPDTDSMLGHYHEHFPARPLAVAVDDQVTVGNVHALPDRLASHGRGGLPVPDGTP